MRFFLTMILVFLLSVSELLAQQVGDPAAGFNFNTLDHGTISLSQFQGKVIYMFMFGFA